MFKLSVSENVTVPVKFSLQDGKKIKPFAFTLTCERLTTEQWQERIKDPETGHPSDEMIRETMIDIVTGWQNQTLVLGADNEPADFCPEALEVMVNASGVLNVIVSSYMKENGARTKN